MPSPTMRQAPISINFCILCITWMTDALIIYNTWSIWSWRSFACIWKKKNQCQHFFFQPSSKIYFQAKRIHTLSENLAFLEFGLRWCFCKMEYQVGATVAVITLILASENMLLSTMLLPKATWTPLQNWPLQCGAYHCAQQDSTNLIRTRPMD